MRDTATMSEYVDRAGQPITKKEWETLIDSRERRIARHEFDDSDTFLSTVYQGRPGGVFETAYFMEGANWVKQTETEEEARQAHEQAYEWALGRGPKPDGGVDFGVAAHLLPRSEVPITHEQDLVQQFFYEFDTEARVEFAQMLLSPGHPDPISPESASDIVRSISAVFDGG